MINEFDVAIKQLGDFYAEHREQLVRSFGLDSRIDIEYCVDEGYSKSLRALVEAKVANDTVYLAKYSGHDFFVAVTGGYIYPRAYGHLYNAARGCISAARKKDRTHKTDPEDYVGAKLVEASNDRRRGRRFRGESNTRISNPNYADPTSARAISTVVNERRKETMAAVVAVLRDRSSGHTYLDAKQIAALAGIFQLIIEDIPDIPKRDDEVNHLTDEEVAKEAARATRVERAERARTGHWVDVNRGAAAEYARRALLSEATASRQKATIVSVIGRALYLAGVLASEGTLQDPKQLNRVLDAFDTTPSGDVPLVTKAARSVRAVETPRDPLDLDHILAREARVQPDLYLAREHRESDTFDRGQWTPDPLELKQTTTAIHDRESAFAAAIASAHPMCVTPRCQTHSPGPFRPNPHTLKASETSHVQ